MRKKKIIVYLYNSLEEPLIQGNIFLYLVDAAKSGKYNFYIITYEQKQFELSSDEKRKKREELSAINISWKPYSWSTGSNLKKAIDFTKALSFIWYLRVFKGYKSIISLASVAGAYAYIYSMLFRLKLYLYQYEPHSEYGLDAKLWTEQSLTFKILKRLEYSSARRARVISSGTDYMRNRLNHWKIKGKFFKIPSVVDHNRFVFDWSARRSVRQRIGLEDHDTLVIYPGKFGDLYYNNEIGVFFKALLDESNRYFFVILTLTDMKMAQDAMLNNNIPSDKYLISSASYEEMSEYLSAADIGIVAVPPQPSKIYCSNIKVGEYLCNGLPYLICEGVSEDDKFAQETNTGVTVKEFSRSEGAKAHENISVLLNEEKEELVNRCREAGIKYRSFQFLNPRFREAIETL
ncbi:hypothetical protein [Ekhidna sp.]|uniref:hypothetical protein n=1 Tax=Ekhidna sp. TaxID=2608089 RepID=UPI003B506EE6